MIKKSLFESEILSGMQKNLAKFASTTDDEQLDEAIECLNSAAEIFDDMGLNSYSDQILFLLTKFAIKTADDRHIKGLTPEKMVANLKHHGTMFNLADDGTDLLDIDVNDTIDVESNYESMDNFEDEKD